MRVNRILLSAALVVVALVLQVSVLARLHLPGRRPRPAAAHRARPRPGLRARRRRPHRLRRGPARGPRAARRPRGRPLRAGAVRHRLPGGPGQAGERPAALGAGPMLVVVGAAIGSTLLYAGVGALVGDTAARHVGLAGLLFTAALYDLLLAPFTVPLDHGAGHAAPRTTRWRPTRPAGRAATSPTAGWRPAPGCASATPGAGRSRRSAARAAAHAGGRTARQGGASRGSSGCERGRGRIRARPRGAADPARRPVAPPDRHPQGAAVSNIPETGRTPAGHRSGWSSSRSSSSRCC